MECLVDLPDDAHELADTIAHTRAPWQALTDALTTSGVKFQQRSEIMDTKAKPATPGAKRGRKPKAVNYPGTLLATSSASEAAE
jgi:hypothetical protein